MPLAARLPLFCRRKRALKATATVAVTAATMESFMMICELLERLPSLNLAVAVEAPPTVELLEGDLSSARSSFGKLNWKFCERQ